MPGISRPKTRTPKPVLPRKFSLMSSAKINDYMGKAGNWRIAYLAGHAQGLKKFEQRKMTASWVADAALAEVERRKAAGAWDRKYNNEMRRIMASYKRTGK